ncbi:MAG TPA: hypothetical protein VFZ66_20690 [Herpetosiphonaceae bacterium]
MKRIVLMLGALALYLTSVVPATNAAAQVHIYRGSDQLALATFQRTDGTIVTYATILANDGYYQSPPQEPTPTPFPYVTVAIFQYDTTCPPWQAGCSVTMYANGFTQATVFQTSHDLSSAVLNATVTMTDEVTGRSFPLAIDLRWTGYGDTLRNVGSPFKIREPGIIVTITGNDYRRRADVAGSVVDLNTGVDFTAQADVYAELERASGNTIMVQLGGY